MKWKVYFGIALRLLLCGAIATIGSYIPEHLHEFFGDVLCPGNGSVGHSGYEHAIGEWDWGTRHIIYAITITLLFVLSLISAIIGCADLIKKHYPDIT